MLIGFLVGRNGWVRRIPELMPWVKRVQWWALGVGGVCTLIFGILGQLDHPPAPSLAKVVVSIAYALSRLGMAMFYVLTIVRVAQVPSWQRRLGPMAAAGRMTLTNYLDADVDRDDDFLWLGLRPVEQGRASGWTVARLRHLLHHPVAAERVVVAALPVWTDGVAVAARDLWPPAGHVISRERCGADKVTVGDSMSDAMYRRSSAWRTFALICTIVSYMALALLGPAHVVAQGAPPAPSPSGSGETFKQEQLDQMLAPIALYPDALLSQVLMASTYPLEIVEAARWLDQNKGLTGDALFSALKNQPWDESVKSLCAFPEVLDRMNKDIAWTQKLGDAFLGQPEQVMDTVQSLRKRADAAGNLKSNEQQTVTVDNNYITVEPANPQVIYVPTYQPTVVYGVWPYPAYPPYYPPYWVAPGAAFINGVFWGVGIAAGAALWGASTGTITTSTSTSIATTTSTAPTFPTATGSTTPPIARACRTGTTRRGRNMATSIGRRRRPASNSVDAKAARVAAASMIVRDCRTRPPTAEAAAQQAIVIWAPTWAVRRRATSTEPVAGAAAV